MAQYAGSGLILGLSHSSTPASSISPTHALPFDLLIDLTPSPASLEGELSAQGDTDRIALDFGRDEMSGARNLFIKTIAGEGNENGLLIASAVYDLLFIKAQRYQGQLSLAQGPLRFQRFTGPISNTDDGPLFLIMSTKATATRRLLVLMRPQHWRPRPSQRPDQCRRSGEL